MKLPFLLLVLSLSPFCWSQQIGQNTFVPTWQPKFNLYQTDTITNIKTTLQSKKYDALKVGYKSTVVGSDLKNSVDHDLNFNVGAKFLSGTLSITSEVLSLLSMLSPVIFFIAPLPALR